MSSKKILRRIQDESKRQKPEYLPSAYDPEKVRKKILAGDPIKHTWQLCPKCNGSGKAMNFSNELPLTTDTCDVCSGKKIISTITGQPPI